MNDLLDLDSYEIKNADFSRSAGIQGMDFGMRDKVTTFGMRDKVTTFAQPVSPMNQGIGDNSSMTSAVLFIMLGLFLFFYLRHRYYDYLDAKVDEYIRLTIGKNFNYEERIESILSYRKDFNITTTDMINDYVDKGNRDDILL